MDTILLGAVAYDPKVVTIWEGIRAHFQAVGRADGLRALLELRAPGRVAARRATSTSPGTRRSRTCACGGARRARRSRSACGTATGTSGARSSCDATPASARSRTSPARRSRSGAATRRRPASCRSTSCAQAGVDLARVKVLPFDTDLGKHGDTGTSELDVLAALRDGRAQAGTLGDLVWVGEQAAGRVDPARDRGALDDAAVRPLHVRRAADAPPRPGATRSARALTPWTGTYPAHRRLLEMEGLRRWMPPREEGYRSLEAALDATGGW